MTSVHNIRTEAMEPGDVYVGRKNRRLTPDSEGADGYFGNPFPVGELGREEAIRRFALTARARIAGDADYRERVKALHGKRLFCWCAPKACHADVLAHLAAELNDEEARP